MINCQENSPMASNPEIHSIIGHRIFSGPSVVDTENTLNWSAS